MSTGGSWSYRPFYLPSRAFSLASSLLAAKPPPFEGRRQGRRAKTASRAMAFAPLEEPRGPWFSKSNVRIFGNIEKNVT